MKLIVREHVNKIIEVEKKIFSVHIDALDSYGKISESIGQEKGDLIVFQGAGNPVRLPASNAAGKVLTSDPTAENGVIWADAGSSSTAASIVLYNATGVQVLAGTVVYNDPTLPGDTGQTFYKAGSCTAGQLYVTSENCDENEPVACYGIEGTICNVLCDTAAVAVGDRLIVSGDGICTPSAGTSTVGIALTSKAAGSTGQVKVRLVGNRTAAAVNDYSTATAAGNVCKLARYETGVYPYTSSVEPGDQPIGVQVNAQSLAGAPELLAVVPGEEAYVSCDVGMVKPGDWLVPSLTRDGHVMNGDGYGIGIALESKDYGSRGLVRCRLNPGMHRKTTRPWYLSGTITEEDIIAVFQFSGRESEEEALAAMNDPSIVLTKSHATITWDPITGFTIPATANRGLSNAALQSGWADVKAAAFGLTQYDPGGSDHEALTNTIGGIKLSTKRVLGLGAVTGSATFAGAIGTNKTDNSTGIRNGYSGYATPNSLGVNWTDASEIFVNGESCAAVDGSGTYGTAVSDTPMVMGTFGGSLARSAFKVQALILLNRILTAEEQLFLHQCFTALGSIWH